MKDWGVWEWAAYGTLWVGAIILAIDASVKVASEELKKHIPSFVHKKLWAFTPLLCVIVGTIMLVGHEFGYLSSSSHLAQETTSRPPRLEITKMYLHVPDEKQGMFLNYWISNNSDTVILGAVQGPGSSVSDHRLTSEEEQQAFDAVKAALIFPSVNISDEISPRAENTRFYTFFIQDMTKEKIESIKGGKAYFYIFIVFKYGDEITGRENIMEWCNYYYAKFDVAFNCQSGTRVYSVPSPKSYKVESR